jgi:hypothetical protein
VAALVGSQAHKIYWTCAALIVIRQADMGNQYYWNQKNFEGLTSLSLELRTDSRLESLARYCDLRVKGLRPQALTELRAFIEQARFWDVTARREAATRILDAYWKVPQAHWFLTEPLRKQLLEAVLEEWRAAEPDNPIPTRYLALLCHDRRLLYDALGMNPKDDQVRAMIAAQLIKFVDYATHHLVEGSFIGDEAESDAALVEAAAVLKEVSDPSSVQPLNDEAQSLAALLADWREYRDAPQGSFPEWCHQRNRPHHWWSIVYYDQRKG